MRSSHLLAVSGVGACTGRPRMSAGASRTFSGDEVYTETMRLGFLCTACVVCAVAGLAACNALTGVSDLATCDGCSAAGPGGPGGPDGGNGDGAMMVAVVGDAGPDALPPTCTGSQTVCEGVVAAQCVNNAWVKTT